MPHLVECLAKVRKYYTDVAGFVKDNTSQLYESQELELSAISLSEAR